MKMGNETRNGQLLSSDVEADPDDALPAQFAGQDQRRLRRIDQRHRPGRRLGGQALQHLHVVETR